MHRRSSIASLLACLALVLLGYIAGRFAPVRRALAGDPPAAIEAVPVPPPGCPAGDVNGDQRLDLSDPVYLLQHLFQGGSAPAPCSSGDVSTIFVVRHADRDSAPDACPDDCPSGCINEAGHARAQRLAEFLDDAGLDHLVASDLCRTHQTIRPVAEATGLPVVELASEGDVADHLLALPQGSTTLVVHHSFTIHGILEALGLPDSVREFPVGGTAYDTCFVVIVPPTGPLQYHVLHY